MSSEKRKYIIYDGRACGGIGTRTATVLVNCNSNKEAESFKGQLGQMACYSYLVEGDELVDERWEWDYHE